MKSLQVFSYTANKEIRTDDLCLDVSKLNGPVMMLKCHHLKGNQLWEYDPVVSEGVSAEANFAPLSSHSLFKCVVIQSAALHTLSDSAYVCVSAEADPDPRQQ